MGIKEIEKVFIKWNIFLFFVVLFKEGLVLKMIWIKWIVNGDVLIV